MSVDAYDGILVAAVFLGAVVQGFSGFAFSAVAGAILLQFQSPATTIPLLMICSLLIQGYVLLRLRAVVSPSCKTRSDHIIAPATGPRISSVTPTTTTSNQSAP